MGKLITFDTAKLAKEKGFNEYCDFAHDNWNEIIDWRENLGEQHLNSKKNSSVYYSAPSQGQLENWLLQEKHINIEITFDDNQWLIYVGEFTIPDSSVEFVEAIECEGFNDAINKKPIAKEKALQHALKL